MCYYAEIKKMMELSKERNESVTKVLAGGIVFVEYSRVFEEYTLKFSWRMNEDDSNTRTEVQELLAKYSKSELVDVEHLDVIQIGLVSIYNTNADQLCNIIELIKARKLNKSTRDTKYIFGGRKVLRIVQYIGELSNNSFDFIDSIAQWNDNTINEKNESKSLIEIMKGIRYYYSTDTHTVVFSIGCESKKVIFEENISGTIPPVLCVDSIRGLIEHHIKD